MLKLLNSLLLKASQLASARRLKELVKFNIEALQSGKCETQYYNHLILITKVGCGVFDTNSKQCNLVLSLLWCRGPRTLQSVFFKTLNKERLSLM